jgi:(1->4)-alpha-D-glucan 1-alpha-D-glucosylmutase
VSPELSKGSAAKTPGATYRIQLHPGFGFYDAAGIAQYIADLGVTHFYASPYLQAARGSTHGYDVVDHSQVNAELGGAAAHERHCQALEAAGLGQVLDIVPNHMAITGRENAWWWDVLENGPSSVYASYFDVDWNPPESKLRNMVLMPVLGDHYGRVLEAGELQVERDGGTFTVRYYDNVVPVAPRSLDTLLDGAAQRLDEADACRDELESIATAFGRLPPSWATDRESVRERHRDKEVLRTRLTALAAENPNVAAAIDAEVDAVNGDHDALDRLLDRQNYRLAFWRTAGQELDYRRFFDITTLVGLRVEDPQVFDDSHRLVLEWLHGGVLDGVRIDHPDGLLDPTGYLRRLHEEAPDAWVVVEKILEPGERLPDWPVAGTTGYDFLNRIGGVFVDPAGEQRLTQGYARFTQQPGDYDDVVATTKRLAVRQVLAADLNRLTDLLVRVCEGQRRYRDYTRAELRDTLAEVLTSYPVYRTYVDAATGTVSEDDRVHVTEAIESAAARRPDLDRDLLSFLQDLLLLRVRGVLEDELAMRVQQVSRPAMAQGVEDTAFYRYNPLTSLNEVGGDPGQFGMSVDEFHAACIEAYEKWPAAMLALSTHDTKRSEDVRARISVLSEIPDRWNEAVLRWSQHNDRHRTDGMPDHNAEWLYYQALTGAWPLTADRAAAYMEKASKEAKVHTTWIDPVPAYDDALHAFVESTLQDREFTDDVERFVASIIEAGRINALAQKLVQLTAPGVPDLYQGTELWDLSLVDPDNRHPVDFELRRKLLAELPSVQPEDVLARADEGLPKLLVVRAALHARSRAGRLGPYVPLPGPVRALAFARGDDLVTVVPRFVMHGPVQGRLDLPAGRWRHALTGDEIDGGPIEMTDLLHRFPVALLVRP